MSDLELIPGSKQGPFIREGYSSCCLADGCWGRPSCATVIIQLSQQILPPAGPGLARQRTGSVSHSHTPNADTKQPGNQVPG